MKGKSCNLWVWTHTIEKARPVLVALESEGKINHPAEQTMEGRTFRDYGYQRKIRVQFRLTDPAHASEVRKRLTQAVEHTLNIK